jgi:uncharacterized sulfatase
LIVATALNDPFLLMRLAYTAFQLGKILIAFVLTLSTARGVDHVPPNVVMIISDDQLYADFGFMGNADVHTPQLDRLAAQSARFTHGYVPASVCRPSLATLLTGLYPHQHGIHFNHPPPGFARLTRTPSIGKQQYDLLRQQGADLIRDSATLPRLLAAQGYRCLQTGKYWEGHFRNAGFTDGMTLAEPSGGRYGDKQLANGDIVAHGNGDHGLAIGRQTMKPIDDFLDDHGDSPFLIWYAPFLPHTPHDAPQRYVDRVDRRVPEFRRPYYASIAWFDATVGHLIDAIERRGLTENTLFVFVVDNGWEPDRDHFVAHRSEWEHTTNSKRAPFDAVLRTPILVRWDGKTVPATYDTPVSSVDIVPTILAATGVEASQTTPAGVNLWPVATGRQPPQVDRAVFGAIYPGDASVLGNPSADVAYRWVRQGRHKLIVPQSRGQKPPWNRYLVSPALYDVIADPAETTNLINRAELAGTADKLHQQLDQWWLPE